MTVPEYTTGDRTAVVRPGFVALVGPGVSDDAVRALWDAAGDGVVGALAVLARDGLTGLPSFALVAVSGHRVHVALRGDVEVVLTGDTDQVLRAGEVSTWSERTVDGVAEVSVRVPGSEADGSVLPVADGVVRAAEVWVALTDLEVPAVVEPAVEPAVVLDQPAVVAAPAVVPAVDPSAEDTVAEDTVAEDTVAQGAVTDEGRGDATSSDEVVGDPAPEPADDDVDVAWSDAQVTAPDEAAVPVEHLADPAEDVAPDVTTDEHPAEVGFSGASERTDVWSDEVAPAAPEEQHEPLVRTPDGLLDDGPGAADLAEVVAAAEAFLAGPRHVAPHRVLDLPDAVDQPAASEQAEAALGAASADDHDGLTILSSDLAAIRDQLPSWASDEGPFHAPAPVEPARIVLSTGLVVTLDRAVLLGRAPQVARVTNRELPRLVTVPSPQQDISRTHAEVRVEGEHVLVTDLDSTNGVHVSRPGEGARRLHPGEASVVGAGEVVDLGDGVTFTVERGS